MGVMTLSIHLNHKNIIFQCNRFYFQADNLQIITKIMFKPDLK